MHPRDVNKEPAASPKQMIPSPLIPNYKLPLLDRPTLVRSVNNNVWAVYEQSNGKHPSSRISANLRASSRNHRRSSRENFTVNISRPELSDRQCKREGEERYREGEIRRKARRVTHRWLAKLGRRIDPSGRANSRRERRARVHDVPETGEITDGIKKLPDAA